MKDGDRGLGTHKATKLALKLHAHSVQYAILAVLIDLLIPDVPLRRLLSSIVNKVRHRLPLVNKRKERKEKERKERKTRKYCACQVRLHALKKVLIGGLLFPSRSSNLHPCLDILPAYLVTYLVKQVVRDVSSALANTDDVHALFHRTDAQVGPLRCEYHGLLEPYFQNFYAAHLHLLLQLSCPCRQVQLCNPVMTSSLRSSRTAVLVGE
eukprot:1150850-Pelagomonas_calceolata.AAC.2